MVRVRSHIARDGRVAGNQCSEAHRQRHRKGGGEQSGRNESEGISGPEMTSPEGRARTEWAKARMGTRKLTDTGIPLQRGGSDGMTARTHHATGEALAAPVEKSPEQGRSYNRQNGKWAEGGRVADGPVVALMRGNARVSEEALLLLLLFQHK
jgi:hypothetical protein